MPAFELYFNPKNREDIFLSSFVYKPENIYQKSLGNLYLVGELTQALPQNLHFLANLATVLKKEYFSSGLKRSSEISLREALKSGNQFLETESKKGNVRWLGNLKMAVLSVKDQILNFAKVGDMKIFLVRGEELIKISESLDNELPQANPLRVFGNMAGGKLSSDDKIIVLSHGLLSSFGKNQTILKQFSKVSNEKELKQVLKTNQEVLSEALGVCLFLTVADQENQRETVTLRQELPKFSFKKALVKPALLFFFKIKKQILKIRRPEIKAPSLKIPTIKSLSFLKIKLPQFTRIKPAFTKKKILPVFSLVLLLIFFSFLFQGEKEEELKTYQQALAEAQSKAMLAESLLVIKEEEEKAKTLFQEALTIISPLTKRGSPLREEALSLKKSIEENLK